MHHVWLGGKQIPKQLTDCMKTCYDKHPTWKHIVWTEENMPNPFFFWDEWGMDNNYARKSDLLRLQVLYNYGGVYLDTDVECIKPIDNLISKHSFVMGTECSHVGYNEIHDPNNCDQGHINNAVIASSMGNPILVKIIETIKRNYATTTINKRDNPLDYVAQLSGPCVFNEMRGELERAGKLYPNTYFYPTHYSNKLEMKYWQIPTDPEKLDERTHLIHHFAASWYKQK